MSPPLLPTPEGALCNANIDLYDVDSPVCGKPAVISWWLEEDEPPSEDPKHENWCHNCEEHKIRRLRIEAEHDQKEAYEAEHGYPPLDIFNLAYRLGLSLARFEEFLDHTAPTIIMRHTYAVYQKRRGHVKAWLGCHTPESSLSHVAAVNSIIEAYRRDELLREEDEWSEEAKENLLLGLREVRRLAAEEDVRRLS
jgi:hypothetical protein